MTKAVCWRQLSGEYIPFREALPQRPRVLRPRAAPFDGRHGAFVIYGDSGDARLLHQIHQAAATCRFFVSPTQASYRPLSSGSELGPYYPDVSTQPGDCNWTASSTVSWIRVLYSSSGKGAGRVFYDVQNNTGSTSRTGEVIV